MSTGLFNKPELGPILTCWNAAKVICKALACDNFCCDYRVEGKWHGTGFLDCSDHCHRKGYLR